MRFTIRRAEIADAASIARVHVASWRSTYGGIVPQAYLDSLEETVFASRWQQWLGEQKVTTLVAGDDVAVFGFISGGLNREPDPSDVYDGELYAVYLLEEYQRSGIGRAMVQALAAILRDEGRKGMMVWLLEANSAAGFYRRLGAVDVASREIEIGGARLAEIALGWLDLRALL
ncbi:GNAT family N-acetyltransferase [Acidicapsa dinghuensis]|uniref:GNAT family N-acetyltransferase n=1 Tax=Acidicapsa dinghuensis TaxID=2218256 RepID=A0ABW1E922_9BACT|nr:GNAT family N-acetyltransferase [Acidicapsa dinghuensis]